MDPDFVQNAALIAVALVTAFIGVFKYIKTEAKAADKPAMSDTGTVLAASFLDSRLVRELIEALRIHTEEYARETRKVIRGQQELTTALQENADAVLSNTDAAINILRFMKKQEREDALNV